MCRSMLDLQSVAAEIRRGKKDRKIDRTRNVAAEIRRGKERKKKKKKIDR